MLFANYRHAVHIEVVVIKACSTIPRVLILFLSAVFFFFHFGACKSDFTRLLEGHRDEAEAFLREVQAVEASLGEAPSGAPGFDLPPGVALGVWNREGETANTVFITVEELGRLHEASENLVDISHVRAQSQDSLIFLWEYLNGRERGRDEELAERFQEYVDWYSGIRFVAVVVTDSTEDGRVAGNSFSGGRFDGRVLLWDLHDRRFRGAVTISVRDTRGSAYVAGDSSSHSLNGSLNTEIRETVREAIRTGSNVSSDLRDR